MTMLQFQNKLANISKVENLLGGKPSTEGASSSTRSNTKSIAEAMLAKGIKVPK